MAERIQKLLASWGVASRRHSEQLIQAGRVTVNGKVAHLGQKADPERDRIRLDGRELSAANRPDQCYLLVNKPVKVVSTCQDPRGRKTVLSLLPHQRRQGTGIHPVGRLDYNSSGALLLTNDGDFTYQLTHPRHHIPKTYRVVVAGKPSSSTLHRWRRGVILSGQPTQPAQVEIVAATAPNRTELQIVLWEGRNRQIRRTAELLGHPVKRLHRTAIGPLQLGNLPPGKFRPLTHKELKALRTVAHRNSNVADVTES